MNSIQLFQKENIGQIRTQLINGEIYLCLKDVCKILDIRNVSQCKKRLSQKGICITDTLSRGGIQKLIFINESNLYKVIFQSRKPEAEAFTEWVTSEVLPSIRKTGQYISNTTILQLEKRIQELEEANKPFKKVTEESILLDYFNALKQALGSGKYYLKRRKSNNTYTGQLLGTYDMFTYSIIGQKSYDIYKEYADEPVHRQALYNLLLTRGYLIPPSKEETQKTKSISITKRCIDRKEYRCLVIKTEKIPFALL